MCTKYIIKFYYNKIWCAALSATLHSVVVSAKASAQQVQIGGANITAGGSDASSSINNVLDFLIDQMLAIGASLSVVVALGVIFAVKIGWMQRRQLMDWAWLIIAMIALPVVIPAVFTFAQSSS